MAYIVRSKKTNGKSFLVRGHEEWEFYWTSDPLFATQFKTAQEVTGYLSGHDINEIEIIDPSEVITAPAPLTLGSLPEGKKFQYAADRSTITFMKVLQPTDKLVDWTHGECDGRRYLHASEWGIWVVILESKNDCEAVAIGRVILLNNSILVQEVQ